MKIKRLGQHFPQKHLITKIIERFWVCLASLVWREGRKLEEILMLRLKLSRCKKKLSPLYFRKYHKKVCGAELGRQYKCKVCGKTGFVNSVTLRNHVRSRHSSEKPDQTQGSPARCQQKRRPGGKETVQVCDLRENTDVQVQTGESCFCGSPWYQELQLLLLW